MQYWAQINPPPNFSVLATTHRSQAATLVVAPNDHVGGTDNAHPDADQWLYVIAGSGRAVFANETVEIGPGAVVLIEAGESHEIRNLDDSPLEALTIYTSAVY